MALIAETCKTLGQLATLLNALNQEQYQRELALISHASIGKHVRHILEFYECLFNGIPVGIVNYDARKRKAALETELHTAQKIIDAIVLNIDTLDLQKHLQLEADFETSISLKTTVERELLYNLEHTVHHLAILKIAVNHYWPETDLNPNLGVASSTQRHQEACVQ